jgi:predicted metalloprotease with PDZ domain
VAGLTYRLRMPEPHTHFFHVEVEAGGVSGAAELVMPSWTPGSYLIREFPRNVVAFMAFDGAGRPLAVEKTDKNSWRVEAPGDGTLRARYVVYADELSVRTSHLDAGHAHVNGASVFAFVRGREHEPHTVEVHPPAGWRVTTPLPAADAPNTFTATDYDHLVDSPLEMGTHALLEWEVEGKPHRYAIWGRGNYDPQRLAADTTRIIRAEKALFGVLPYPDYTFFVLLSPGGSGGLEHRDSTVLLADRWSFRGAPYEHFLALVAHEYFHLWNGKRIRPAALGPFDYTREAYTRDLWVVEGITTYYTDVLLRRAGIISQQRFLDRLGDQVTRLFATPGRMVQPLEDSSFDTWIKFYRPDANSPNATISYYQKGALVALLLDLKIREATANARSLDDVMRLLWERYGAADTGFPPGGVEAVAAEVAGTDLSGFFDAYLRSTRELDYAAHLAAAGLELVWSHEARPAPPRTGAVGDPSAPPPTPQEVRIGVQMKFEGNRPLIGNVLADTPAWRAGLNAGDELVALDGLRVGFDTLTARMMEKKPGDKVALTIFRRDELLTVALEVETSPPPRFVVRPKQDATPEQQRLREDWLRTDVAPEAPAAPR